MTLTRYVRMASQYGERHHQRLMLLVFVTACVLRVSLALVNTDANDDHISISQMIAYEGRVPGLTEHFEGYHPKLYHWTVAMVLRLVGALGFPVEVRIANLINCLAGIGILLVLRNFLWRSDFSASTILVTFSLIALNPALIAINSQATNDTFVILFSTISLYYGVKFFNFMSFTSLLGMLLNAILATLSKASGLILMLIYCCGFIVVLLKRVPFSPWGGRRVLTAMVASLVLFFSAVSIFGPYYDHFRATGSPFAQNMSLAPLPHFFKETDAYRPGIRSVVGGLLTFRLVDMLREPKIMRPPDLHDKHDPTNYHVVGYPLHQTSLWSQLYGRYHFVHYDNFPPTWWTDNPIVPWIGRTALVLGLAPTAILLLGILRGGLCIAMSLMGRWKCGLTAGDLVLVVAAYGFLAFSVAYALRFRDVGALKVIYIFPGLLAFGWCFARGYEMLMARLDPKHSALPAMFNAGVAALCAVYVLDIVTLTARLAKRALL
jgi:hypothetical protein